MNAKVKQLWLEALRSGEYEQGHHYLRDTFKGEDYFCCLGVLCDVYQKEHTAEPKWEHNPLTNTWTFEHVGNILPLTVVQWAELPDANPRVTLAGERNALSVVNDRGVPFVKIADIIEEQL